jgi:hypothetical protein
MQYEKWVGRSGLEVMKARKELRRWALMGWLLVGGDDDD